MSDFMHALIGQLGCGPVVFIGHSQGCLVGLDMAARYQDDLGQLVLIAGGLSIPVNDYLVDASQNKLDKAINMMTGWGHSQIAHKYDNELPGHSHLGFGRALMASNDVNALHADLSACKAYGGGADAAAAVKVPTLVILAAADKMTPVKSGRAMAVAITGAELVEVVGAGHMLPAEKPLQVNHHITRFLSA
jgi:pimeloyl-ACP methyl ester carboxylesterase